jgi:DNA-binding NarL/FixJ family response regulator
VVWPRLLRIAIASDRPLRHRAMQTTFHHTSPSDVPAVLIAHQDALVCAGVAAALSRKGEFVVRVGPQCRPPACAVSLLALLGEIDVVIADYETALAVVDRGPDGRLFPSSPSPRVIVISDRGGERDVCHALDRGIRGCLLLGCDLDEMVRAVLDVHRGQRHLGPAAARRIDERLGHEALTPRETEVLQLLAAGCANKVVASTLDIALGTVKVHVKSILAKLEAKSRTQAAAVAHRRGLLQREDEVPDPVLLHAAERPAA